MKKLLAAVLVLFSCAAANATLPICWKYGNVNCMLAVVNGDGSGAAYPNYADAVIVTGWGGIAAPWAGHVYTEPVNEFWGATAHPDPSWLSASIQDETGNGCSVGSYISSVYVLDANFYPETYSNSYTPAWSIMLIEQDGYGTNDWWGADEDSSCSRLPSGCVLADSSGYASFNPVWDITASQMDATTSGNRTAIAYRIAQDILNQQAWDGGIFNVMTDEVRAIANPTTSNASNYLAYAQAITDALNTDGIAHVMNCGLHPGSTDSSKMLGWTDYHTLIHHVDGLVFEFPFAPNECNTVTKVASALGFYREAMSAGCCTIMLPESDLDRADEIQFLAGLATYLQGPLVAIADEGDDVSWKTWGYDHGWINYYYDTLTDNTHMDGYAVFDDGWWLHVDFYHRTTTWTDYDPR